MFFSGLCVFVTAIRTLAFCWELFQLTPIISLVLAFVYEDHTHSAYRIITCEHYFINFFLCMYRASCTVYYPDQMQMPMPVAALSKEWVCGRCPAEIVGSNPIGGRDVCLVNVVCCPGRGLCDQLITRPDESYRLWCAEYDVETS